MKQTKCGIYKITNLISNQIYVGQSIDILCRWRHHKTDAFKNDQQYQNNPLYKDIRRYGLNNFLFEIIEECRVNELNDKQKYWISYYNSYNNGYNRTQGGQDASHANKMTDQMFNNIIHDLQTTLDNSEIIGKKYGISGRIVRAINSGASWRKDYLNYPIRESLIEIQRKQKKEQEQKNKLLNADQVAKLHVAQVEKIRMHGIQLAKNIIVYGFSAIGRLYQVSHTTVRRWCKKDNIPDTIKELTIWYHNIICKHDQFSCQNA